MFKRSFVCLCVFFIASLLIINSAYALSLMFDPSTQTVSQGEYSYVNILMELSELEGLLIGFDLLLEYNPSILFTQNDYNIITESVGDIDKFDSGVDVTQDEGKIYLWWLGEYNFDDPEDGLTQDEAYYELAKLKFSTKGCGESDLIFSAVTLNTNIPDTIIFTDNPNPDNCIYDISEITTNGSITVSACNTIPEPATFLLLGTLLVSFGFLKRKEIY